MSRADKKQRHKAKREAKRLAARRRESISPVKRLAEAKGEIECWMSEGFGELGQLQILIHKRAAGLSGVACFLIDRGVVGLKDAWTKLRVDREEFDFMVERSAEHGIPMLRGTLEEARRWVAGGVRWAQQNGMRLPKDWVKVASIMGGVGDWAKADVSEFEMEFAGRPDDLRQRLIGQPFDEFTRRTDIRFIFNESAPMMDIESGEYEDGGDLESELDAESILDGMPSMQLRSMLVRFTASATALQAMTTEWLEARGEKPPSGALLLEAWQSVMLASALTEAAVSDVESDQGIELFEQMLDDIRRRTEPDRVDQYDWAVDKALEHLNADAELLANAIGEDLPTDNQLERFIDIEPSDSRPMLLGNLD